MNRQNYQFVSGYLFATLLLVCSAIFAGSTVLAAPVKPLGKAELKEFLINEVSQKKIDKSADPTKLSNSESNKTNTNNEVQNRQVMRLIRQLDSDKLQRREAATEELKKFGSIALQNIEQAVINDTGEVMRRGLEVIKDLCFAEDQATNLAAFSALKRIAQSNNATAASLAQAAKKQISPYQLGKAVPRFETPPVMRVPFAQKPLVPLIPNKQMVSEVKSMTFQQQNGELQVDVNELDRKIQILQKRDNSISVKITDKQGNQKTFLAENLQQLMQQNGEAFSIYQKYTQLQQSQDFLLNPQVFRPLGKNFDPFAEIKRELQQLEALRDQLFKDLD